MATSTIKYLLTIFSKNTYQTTKDITTADTSFTITATKSGYTPISYSLRHGYSSQIMGGVEQCTMQDSLFEIVGYARSMSGNTLNNVDFYADVWWVKNV